MSTGKGPGMGPGTGRDAGANAEWPADVIHVNEDGWVLINRGSQQGVPVGMRLLVVGAGTRELRDLFPSGADSSARSEDEEEASAGQAEEPVVLRTRRTYELLEVVHVEPECAIAIAARTPAERRPQFYRGPQGDLLIWVPLPANFTYPRPDADEDEDELEDEQAEGEAEGGAEGEGQIDTPPQRADQEDERWEEALPLNGVGVGDQVVPAVPASSATGSATGAAAGRAGATSSAATAGEPPLTQFEQGRNYDWMKPQS